MSYLWQEIFLYNAGHAQADCGGFQLWVHRESPSLRSGFIGHQPSATAQIY
jgi:hypothetical protein